MNKNLKAKWKAQQRWERTYQRYFTRLEDYALSLFEWTGLPDTVDERFMEITMLREGQVVFFDDPDYGYMALPVQYGGMLNAYRNPTTYRAVSIGYNRLLKPDDGVIIWNNYGRHSMIPFLEDYAEQLTHLDMTIDINIQAQKTPLLLLADESQRMTLLNAYNRYMGYEPFIFGNKKGFDKDAIQAIETLAPYVADKLQVTKHEIWNEAMTFIGVGNAKQDKKERLVEDEVSANDEQIEQARFIMLDARRQACNEIKKRFGVDVWVDYKLKALEREESSNEGGETNEDD